MIDYRIVAAEDALAAAQARWEAEALPGLPPDEIEAIRAIVIAAQTELQEAQQTYGRLQTMSAIQEFEGLMGEIGTHVEAMLPLIDKASGIFAVNQLQEMIDATPAGELVQDSARTREALSVFVALLAAFIVFAETPLAEQGLTPKQIMRLRG